MSKLWNLSVVMLAAFMAASCGSDNKAGSGNGVSANGVPSTSSSCSTSKTSGSAGSWDALKQSVYNCQFDYVVQNISAYTNNSYNGYGYNYGYSILPLVVQFSYSMVQCDQYGGCYNAGGTNYVSVDLNQNTGAISSIVDFRSSNTTEAQAHNRLKNLVLNVSDVRQVGTKSWEFRKSGRKYVIDLEWPMIANPVSDTPVDTSSSQQGYWISGESSF